MNGMVGVEWLGVKEIVKDLEDWRRLGRGEEV